MVLRVLVVIAGRDDKLILVLEVPQVTRHLCRNIQAPCDSKRSSLDEVSLQVDSQQRVSQWLSGAYLSV